MGSLLEVTPNETNSGSWKIQLQVLCTEAIMAIPGSRRGGNEKGLDKGRVAGHVELSIKGADGQLVDLLVNAAPRIRYVDQAVMGALLIAQDITERKTLEMATRVCLAAKAASVAKTEQLSFLCHEIRNPLNGVIGYITFLEETPMNEEQQDLVNTTQQCCLQLRRIVNDVLDLSSIEQGKVEIEKVPFVPAELIQTVMSQVRVVMQDKGLAMKVDISKRVAECNLVGDPPRIMQILSNFAWNACKFTSEGNVTFRIEIIEGISALPDLSAGQRGQKNILFSVVDTGPGIPQSVQENLFQPFVQGDKSTTRHHGGTGLGLSICRQLAKLMGGDVSCVSDVGQGATFRLHLPMEVQKKEKEGGHRQDNIPTKVEAENAPEPAKAGMHSSKHCKSRSKVSPGRRSQRSSRHRYAGGSNDDNTSGSDSDSFQRGGRRGTRNGNGNGAGRAQHSRHASRGRCESNRSLASGSQRQHAKGGSDSTPSRDSSFVGSLKESILHSIEVGQRRYHSTSGRHDSSIRSLNDLDRAGAELLMHESIMQCQSWNFVVVREHIDDKVVSVLGELEYGKLKRQCWGSASNEIFGFAAIEVASKNALSACLQMFPELVELLQRQGVRNVFTPVSSSQSTVTSHGGSFRQAPIAAGHRSHSGSFRRPVASSGIHNNSVRMPSQVALAAVCRSVHAPGPFASDDDECALLVCARKLMRACVRACPAAVLLTRRYR